MPTRKTKTVYGTINDGDTEATTGSIAKAVNDALTGKTAISVSLIKIGNGKHAYAIVTYDE